MLTEGLLELAPYYSWHTLWRTILKTSFSFFLLHNPNGHRNFVSQILPPLKVFKKLKASITNQHYPFLAGGTPSIIFGTNFPLLQNLSAHLTPTLIAVLSFMK